VNWQRWRVPLAYVVAGVYFWLARPTPRAIWIGSGVAVLGLILRAAAAGHLRKHEVMSVAGPYRYTRNPLYLGSVILAVGFAVAGNSLIAAAIAAAYFLLFYPPVMRREEQELRARYGPAFDDYAARVPLFFPRVTPAKIPAGQGQRFTWRQFVRNGEYNALLGALAGLALLWIKLTWLR
jgi:protein-S-isoprenylcysteine O-methyltransferase Ste14